MSMFVEVEIAETGANREVATVRIRDISGIQEYITDYHRYFLMSLDGDEEAHRITEESYRKLQNILQAV
jgi:hypothetical protein